MADLNEMLKKRVVYEIPDHPILNTSIDSFIKEASAKNVALDYMTHPGGHHAFDTLDDVARSHEIIKRTLEFTKTCVGKTIKCVNTLWLQHLLNVYPHIPISFAVCVSFAGTGPPWLLSRTLQCWHSLKIAFRLPSEAGAHAQLAHAIVNKIDS